MYVSSAVKGWRVCVGNKVQGCHPKKIQRQRLAVDIVTVSYIINGKNQSDGWWRLCVSDKTPLAKSFTTASEPSFQPIRRLISLFILSANLFSSPNTSLMYKLITEISLLSKYIYFLLNWLIFKLSFKSDILGEILCGIDVTDLQPFLDLSKCFPL